MSGTTLNSGRHVCQWGASDGTSPQKLSYTTAERSRTQIFIELPNRDTEQSLVLDLTLGSHSECEVHWLNTGSPDGTGSLTYSLHAFLGAHSKLHSFQIHAPKRNITLNEKYTLDQSSSLEVFTLVFQKHDGIQLHYTPHVHHQGENSTSSVKVRSLLAGSTDTSLCGRISLAKDASASAHYHNHNLMIYGTPKLRAQPELEIDFDRVQCTHGVTLGQMDHHALFYMQSRGCSLKVATNTLLQSFMRKDPSPLFDLYTATIDPLISQFF